MASDKHADLGKIENFVGKIKERKPISESLVRTSKSSMYI